MKLAKQNIAQNEIGILNKEIDRIAHILRALTSFSESDVREKGPVDINALLSDLVKITKESLRKHSGIDVHLDLKHSLPTVISDENSIKQILVNLIKNAAEAMREGGNHSPSAEFNILVDPHAADIVFRCGRKITVFGLDVTHQVLATAERRERIRGIDNPAGQATAGMLDFFNRHDTAKYKSAGAPLHDPCTIAFLLQPDLFELKSCNLTVETESELTMGHTAVDFWHVTDRPHNVDWAYSVDADGFYDLLVRRLERYGNG